MVGAYHHVNAFRLLTQDRHLSVYLALLCANSPFVICRFTRYNEALDN